MGDFVGYNGAAVFVTHPKTVFEDGYMSVGTGGVIVSCYSGKQPGVPSALWPNSILQSPVTSGFSISSTGQVMLTLKQPFFRLMYASCDTVVPSQAIASCLPQLQLQYDTVGATGAGPTGVPAALPVIVFQYMSGGATSIPCGPPPNTGLRFLLVLQNAAVY